MSTYQPPRFPYYVINRITGYVVAGFDSATDGQVFISTCLCEPYRLVSDEWLRLDIRRLQAARRAAAKSVIQS